MERSPTGVVVRIHREVLRIDAWGADTFRVQVAWDGEFDTLDDALLRREPTPAQVTKRADGVWVENGGLTAVVEPSGRLVFRDTVTGEELLAEPPLDPREPPPVPSRRFLDRADGDVGNAPFVIEAAFASCDGERLYGLGQPTGLPLDLKGSTVDLLQRNGHVAVPVVVSSRGYGMFWNSPSVGRVTFADNLTRWHADAARQIDYFVYSGHTPLTIMRRYAELTGFAPVMPYWATGFWQSNSYYTSQDELLGVAREYWARGVPLAAIFVDYMHWTHLGNWDWDSTHWPDPAAMVAELAEHDVHLMVSVWPHVSPHSDHYDMLRSEGLLVRGAGAEHAVFSFADRAHPEGVDLALLDLTQEEARRFLGSRLSDGYGRIGIDTFWLDACEPELTGDGRHLREASAHYDNGDGLAVSSMFPLFDAVAARACLDSAGATDGMLLARSAWAGAQRQGVAVWSGDVPSTWASLRDQVRAGLSMMASGLPWWTSDIGGFFLSDVESEDFRELMVRWFQFAVFWPIVRLHGNRHPAFYDAGIFSAGGPNEIWSFGPQVEAVLTPLLAFRERLRPVVHELLVESAASGAPPIRPLWMQFPEDAGAARVDDQFMLGADLLVAPVLDAGARDRRVYLPAGALWRNVSTGDTYEGGTELVVTAPLEVVPMFERVGGSSTVRPPASTIDAHHQGGDANVDA